MIEIEESSECTVVVYTLQSKATYTLTMVCYLRMCKDDVGYPIVGLGLGFW